MQELTEKQSSQIAYSQMDEEDNMVDPNQVAPAFDKDSNVDSPADNEEVAYGNAPSDPAGLAGSDENIQEHIQAYDESTTTNQNTNTVTSPDPDASAGAGDAEAEAKEQAMPGLGSPVPAYMSRQRSTSQEAVEADDPNSELLWQSLEENQDVVAKTKNTKDPNSRLNKVDPDWDYNITMGSVEKRRININNLDGYEGEEPMELWFPVKGAVRKVFVAMKVKRVSDVDNVAETFRMRFHIYFNWLMTEADYRSFLVAKKRVEVTNKYEHLMKWEPAWYPHLEFQNAIEEHTKEWEVYPEQGRFRLQEFKDFAKEKNEIIDEKLFDCEHAKFIRAKLECEMTFAEELELQSFPFDCQDLSCIIHERTTNGVLCRFLPELRKSSFASVDPRYSVIDEWDLETAVLEFGSANAGASRSGQTYSMIVLRLKVKRRWKVFLWNIVFLMMCICALALTAFALDGDDLGERLNLIITLVLTAVAFSYVVFDNLPNVPYLTYMDKYILCGYGFLVCTMVQSAFTVYWGDWDFYFFIAALVIFFAYHAGFAVYALKLRELEEAKLTLSSDDVEKEVNLSRPALEFNYQQRLRAGENGRLLSFLGTLKIPKSMDEAQQNKLKMQQIKMKEIYEAKAKKNNELQHFKDKSMKDLNPDALSAVTHKK